MVCCRRYLVGWYEKVDIWLDGMKKLIFGLMIHFKRYLGWFVSYSVKEIHDGLHHGIE